MHRGHFVFSVLVTASLVFAAMAPLAPALAERVRANDRVRGRDHDAARAGVSRGQVMSLAEVVRIVQSRYPGRLLDASYHELVPGQPVYRVLILTSDHRRLAVWVDARSGQILRVEGAD
jgi:uncharacterized membrane protein YkoI